MSHHAHQICDIATTAKRYVFVGRCWCGAAAEFVEWREQPPRGWSLRQWKRVRPAIFEMILKLKGLKS